MGHLQKPIVKESTEEREDVKQVHSLVDSSSHKKLKNLNY